MPVPRQQNVFSLLILPSIHLLATSPIPKHYKEDSHTHHLHNIITYPLPTPLSPLLATGSVRLSVPPDSSPPFTSVPLFSATGSQDVPTPSVQNKCYKLPPPLLSWCRPTAPAFQPRRELRWQWPDSVSRWPLLTVVDNREEHCIFPGCPGATYNEAPTILFVSACSTPKLRH